MKIFLQNYKPPKLYCGKSEWYVYYHCKNPLTGKWEMFKDRFGLNYQDIKENTKVRKKLAQDLIDSYNERLKAGWSPFTYDNPVSTEYETLKFMPCCKVLAELNDIKKGSLKAKTHHTYRNSIKMLEEWLNKEGLGHHAIEHIKHVHIIRFFDSLRTSESNYSNKTINNYMLHIKVAFNLAVKRELILKSPASGIDKLPEEKGKNFPFSPEQVEAMKKEILKSDPDLWKFLKCIYHFFARPSELLRLKIGDIDLRTRQVIIHSEVGKNKRQLPAEIPDSFLEEIKSWKLDKLPKNWLLFGDKLKPGPKQYHPNRVTERHKAILNACGITDKKYTLYGWKHTGNVDSFLAGVDIWDLMRQNRHHSLDETQNYLRSMGLRPNLGFRNKAPGI